MYLHIIKNNFLFNRSLFLLLFLAECASLLFTFASGDYPQIYWWGKKRFLRLNKRNLLTQTVFIAFCIKFHFTIDIKPLPPQMLTFSKSNGFSIEKKNIFPFFLLSLQKDLLCDSETTQKSCVTQKTLRHKKTSRHEIKISLTFQFHEEKLSIYIKSFFVLWELLLS